MGNLPWPRRFSPPNNRDEPLGGRGGILFMMYILLYLFLTLASNTDDCWRGGRRPRFTTALNRRFIEFPHPSPTPLDQNECKNA